MGDSVPLPGPAAREYPRLTWECGSSEEFYSTEKGEEPVVWFLKDC